MITLTTTITNGDVMKLNNKNTLPFKFCFNWFIHIIDEGGSEIILVNSSERFFPERVAESIKTAISVINSKGSQELRQKTAELSTS